VDGPDEVAPSILFNEGVVLDELARYDEAEPLLRDSVRNARVRGERRIERAGALELATLYVRRGELDRADAELNEIGRTESATLPYVRGLESLARGDALRARDLLADSIDRFIRHKSGSNDVVFAGIELSHAEAALGRTAEALTAAQQALSAAESFAGGLSSYLVGHARLALGEAQLAAGDEAAARGDLRSAADMLARTLGAQHPAAERARRLADGHRS